MMEQPQPHKFLLWFSRIGLTFLVIGTLLSIYSTYTLLRPAKVLKINNVTIVTKQLKSTDVLIYHFNSCKFTDEAAIVYRQIISTDGKTAIPFPAVSSVIAKGCHEYDIPIQMISTTPPGTYMLRGELIFKLGQFREAHVFYESDHFEVVK